MKPRNTGVRSGQPARAAALRLSATDVPGVYRNKLGILVNEDGVKLTFKQVKEADNAQLAAAVEGADHVPAQLLRAWANDPTLPRAVRMDAAKSAASYFSPKLANVTAAVVMTPGRVDYSSMTPEQLAEAMAAIDKVLQIDMAVKAERDA